MSFTTAVICAGKISILFDSYELDDILALPSVSKNTNEMCPHSSVWERGFYKELISLY